MYTSRGTNPQKSHLGAARTAVDMCMAEALCVLTIALVSMKRMSGAAKTMSHIPEPGTVRRDDYQTSIDAACSVDREKIRERVKLLFKEYRELGDADLYRIYCERYGPAVDVSVRKRRGELMQAGYLVKTDKRCTFPTGRSGMVWRYVEPAPVGKLF